MLDRLEKEIGPRLNIQQVADKCGLSKLYDLVYRFGSLTVHAKTLSIAGNMETNEEVNLSAPLSVIEGLLQVTLLVVENSASADDVLRRLGLDKLGGK